VPDAVDLVLDLVAGLEPGILYLVAGLFTFLETSVGIGLLVPGDVVVLLAGSTVTDPARFAVLVVVTVLGSLAGESVGYLLGRRYGDRIRTSRLGRLVGPARWAAAEAFLRGRGGRALAAARFMAVAHAVAPVVAGGARMPFRRFVAWCALGSAAWAVTYVGVGAAVGASWRAYGHRLGLGAWVLLAAAAATALLVRTARRRAARNAAAHAGAATRHGAGAGAEADERPPARAR
jgi:membrane-associated protein